MHKISIGYANTAVEEYEKAIKILGSSNKNKEKLSTLNFLYEKKIRCLIWLGKESLESSYIDEALDILDNNLQISTDLKSALQLTLLKSKGDILSSNPNNAQLAIKYSDDALKITNSVSNISFLDDDLASLQVRRGMAL